jgi:hypothetical protein
MRIDDRVKRILLFISATTLLSVAGLYLYLAVSNDPWWFWEKISRAQVSVDGQTIVARVYRRPSGKLLIDFGRVQSAYVYFPDQQNVGMCNPIKGISVPGYMYVTDYGDDFCPCLMMGGLKTEVDAGVVLKENRIEFTRLDGKRVDVSW